MGELRSASVTLAEIIAFIKQTHQTGRLNVRVEPAMADSPPPAVLIFDAGHLVDARNGGDAGDDLVYRLLGERNATFSFDKLPADQLPPERSVTRVQELLVLAAIGVLSEEDATPPPGEETALPAPAPAATPPPPTNMHTAPRPFKRRNMIPLPAGTRAYADDALPGDLVSLLDLLEHDAFSGFVTWFSEGAEGLLVLYHGQVIDAFWAEVQSPTTYAERPAVRQFAAAASAGGDRHIEVYSLDPNFVWSYSSLAYGAYRPNDQGLSRVNLPRLLDRLRVEEHTGCVKVVAKNHAAYLFLCAGRLLGEYRALPESLELAPGRAMALVTQEASLVDLYTSPSPAELLALNAAAWPVSRVADELRRTAQEVLGAKAGQVINLLNAAGDDSRALEHACVRAKKVTQVFMGPDKHAELSRRMDRLLAHLQ